MKSQIKSGLVQGAPAQTIKNSTVFVDSGTGIETSDRLDLANGDASSPVTEAAFDKYASHSYEISQVNNSPTADFSFVPSDLSVLFTDGSSDPDGAVASWFWDFDDGSTSSEQSVVHDFESAGDYNVTLTVTDNDGAESHIQKSVTVTAPAVQTVTTYNPSVDDLGPHDFWLAEASNRHRIRFTFANFLTPGYQAYLSSQNFGYQYINASSEIYFYTGACLINGQPHAKDDYYDFSSNGENVVHTVEFTRGGVQCLFGNYSNSPGVGRTPNFNCLMVEVASGTDEDSPLDNIFDFSSAVDNGDGTYTVSNTGTGTAPDYTFTATAPSFSQIEPKPYFEIPQTVAPVASLTSATQSGTTLTVSGSDMPTFGADHCLLFDDCQESTLNKSNFVAHSGSIKFDANKTLFGTQARRADFDPDSIDDYIYDDTTMGDQKEVWFSYRINRVQTGLSITDNYKLPRIAGGQSHTDPYNMGVMGFDDQNKVVFVTPTHATHDGGTLPSDTWTRFDYYSKLPAGPTGLGVREYDQHGVNGSQKSFYFNIETILPDPLDQLMKSCIIAIYARNHVDTIPIDPYEQYIDNIAALKTKERMEWTPTATYDSESAIVCKPLSSNSTSAQYDLPYGKTGGYIWVFNSDGIISNGVQVV